MTLETLFQHYGDHHAEQANLAWDASQMFTYCTHSCFARLHYLLDLIASVVLIPLAFIGLALGPFQTLILCSIKKATLLTSSYSLLCSKVERFFTSLLGATLSPANAYYFRDRTITPSALGLILTGLISYIVLQNPPNPNTWS